MIATPASTHPIQRPLDGGDRQGVGAIQDGREPASVVVRPGMLAVVFAGARPARFLADEAVVSVAPGEAVVLAKAEPFQVAWRPAADCVVVQLSKTQCQILVGQGLGAPVRIGAGHVTFAGLSRDTPLGALADEIARLAQGSTGMIAQQVPDLERRLHDGLARLMATRPEAGAILLPAGSVARAIGHIQARLEASAEIDPAAIAAAAGVTPRTLRDGFRACLGVSVSGFIQNARLERARARLCSGRDVRAMQDVARETGFKSASAFTRAYVRAFREAPTETRTRGVRQAGVR